MASSHRGWSESSRGRNRRMPRDRQHRSPQRWEESLNSLSGQRPLSEGRETFAAKNLSQTGGHGPVQSRSSSTVGKERRDALATKTAQSTHLEKRRLPSLESARQLSRDEQRGLVLCDLAHSVCEKMKDVDLAWPTFRAVFERLNETPLRECHDFRSVQMCLLTTYAMKAPLLIATCLDGITDVVLVAVSCLDGRLCSDDGTQMGMSNLILDLNGHVKRGARLVICGEASAVRFAQRVTLELLAKLTKQERSRVTCVGVGSCMTSFDHADAVQLQANHFVTLTSSVYRHSPTLLKNFSQSAHAHAMYVGEHFCVTPGKDGNLQLHNLLDIGESHDLSSAWSAGDKAFKSNLELYLAASPRAPPVKPRGATHVHLAMPREGDSCLLCREMCARFQTSAASRQVEQANVDVLKRAVEYVSISVLQRSKQHRSHFDSTSAAKLLLHEQVFVHLKQLAHLATPSENTVIDWGSYLHDLLAACLSEGKGLVSAVENKKICCLLNDVARVLTSTLTLKEKPKKEQQPQDEADSGGAATVVRGAALAYTAFRCVRAAAVAGAAMAVASPALLVGGLIAGGVVAGGVVAGVQVYREEEEMKMTWEERDKRYRDILLTLLEANSSKDRRWSCLSALQLEGLLARKVPLDFKTLSKEDLPAILHNATDESVKSGLLRIWMAQTMYELRLSLTQTCHIALVGPQNAGKSTFVKEVWQQAAVPNIGMKKHTKEAEVYIMASKIKVLDFPGTTSERETVREEFFRLSAMAGIVIFLAKYDGSPNKHVIDEYRKVKEFARDAPMLVCLTQVSRALDDDDDEEEEDKEEEDEEEEEKDMCKRWALSLECPKDNVLLTELTCRSPKMKQAGVAGCDEIRDWLRKQLVRMEIYDDDDKELELAVGCRPAQQ